MNQNTLRTQERYDRKAQRYNRHMRLVERVWLGTLRQQLWSRCPQGMVLEIGVGTGLNFPYHPKGATVVGIDLSPQMLVQSQITAQGLGGSIQLLEMDVQNPALQEARFDAVVGTFIFCSVPDPLQGLSAVWRVLKPGALLLLLEHVRLPGLLGKLMDIFDPVAVGVAGAHINRDTVANVTKAGFCMKENRGYLGGLVRLIVARRPAPEPDREYNTR